MATASSNNNFLLPIFLMDDTIEGTLSDIRRRLSRYRKAVADTDADIAKTKAEIQRLGPRKDLEIALEGAELIQTGDTEEIRALEIVEQVLDRFVKESEYEATVKAGPWC